MLLYADEAVIHYTSDDIQELKLVLQGDLTNLLAWSMANKLSIHPVKTEVVLFGTHQKTSKVDKFELFLGERLVKQLDHYKYLGIILDAHLNFKEHVAKVFGKVSSRLGALRRIRKNLTLDAANKVYKSTILPILDYCDVAWNSIGQNECKKLERLQNEQLI